MKKEIETMIQEAILKSKISKNEKVEMEKEIVSFMSLLQKESIIDLGMSLEEFIISRR